MKEKEEKKKRDAIKKHNKYRKRKKSSVSRAIRELEKSANSLGVYNSRY